MTTSARGMVTGPRVSGPESCHRMAVNETRVSIDPMSPSTRSWLSLVNEATSAWMRCSGLSIGSSTKRPRWYAVPLSQSVTTWVFVHCRHRMIWRLLT